MIEENSILRIKVEKTGKGEIKSEGDI